MKEFVKIDNSTSIDCVRYDKDDRNLVVRFIQGSEYVYSDVPQETYQNLLESESKGKFFDKEIKKGGFEFEKLA